jgi:hypothetical protein
MAARFETVRKLMGETDVWFGAEGRGRRRDCRNVGFYGYLTRLIAREDLTDIEKTSDSGSAWQHSSYKGFPYSQRERTK